MEIELSDNIIASSFTAESLNLLPKKIDKSVKYSYGVDCPKEMIINKKIMKNSRYFWQADLLYQKAFII